MDLMLELLLINRTGETLENVGFLHGRALSIQPLVAAIGVDTTENTGYESYDVGEEEREV